MDGWAAKERENIVTRSTNTSIGAYELELESS